MIAHIIQGPTYLGLYDIGLLWRLYRGYIALGFRDQGLRIFTPNNRELHGKELIFP